MEQAVERYKVESEPYYLPIGREVELFEAAYAAKLPAMLKGPTGCGKTRFVEYMAYKLGRPLITVACHEDLSSTDLVGRFLLEGDGTVWHDGPLTKAVRAGAIDVCDVLALRSIHDRLGTGEQERRAVPGGRNACQSASWCSSVPEFNPTAGKAMASVRSES